MIPMFRVFSREVVLFVEAGDISLVLSLDQIRVPAASAGRF